MNKKTIYNKKKSKSKSTYTTHFNFGWRIARGWERKDGEEGKNVAAV